MINPFRILFWNHFRDQSWFAFLLGPLLLLALFGLSHAECDFRKSMPAEILAYAPFNTIEQAVNENIPDGYILLDESRYRQDPGHRNMIVIEYTLAKFDYSDRITYTWSWEIPTDLLRLPDCELIPISAPAESIHPRVLELLNTP